MEKERAEDYGPFLQNGSRIDSDGTDSHQGLSVVAGLDRGVRVRNPVECVPHGGNGGVDVSYCQELSRRKINPLISMR